MEAVSCFTNIKRNTNRICLMAIPCQQLQVGQTYFRWSPTTVCSWLPRTSNKNNLSVHNWSGHAFFNLMVAEAPEIEITAAATILIHLFHCISCSMFWFKKLRFAYMVFLVKDFIFYHSFVAIYWQGNTKIFMNSTCNYEQCDWHIFRVTRRELHDSLNQNR